MCVCHQRQSNNMLYKIYDVKNERVAACNRLHTRKDRRRDGRVYRETKTKFKY